jgi:hypothetical protein
MSQRFLLIQFFYNIMKLKIYNMYDNLKFSETTVYEINTDLLFINKDFKFKDSKRDNNIFKSIKKIKYETIKIYL